MNRQISIIVYIFLLLAFLPVWAQELTGFDVQRVNRRYEITYRIDNYSWGDRFDVFFFARPDDNSPWFKLKALVGQYRNVESGNSYKVLWEPILDLKENRSYQLRLFAVNHRYLGWDYDYNKINEIGLAYPISNLQGVSYLINGAELNSSVPVALPVGSYEFSITKDEVIRGYRQVDVPPFRYIEPELEFQDGTITLTCSEPGSTIKIDGKSQTRVENMKIPIGSHQIEVIPPADVKALGIKSFTETIHIDPFENVVREFSFPYGKLSLTSNEENTEYWINETRYYNIQDLKLNPGTYIVTAKINTKANPGYQLEETFIIVPGSDIKYNFEFKYGFLTFNDRFETSSYQIDNNKYLTTPKDVKLLIGDHNYYVFPPSPYKNLSGSFHLEEGDHYSKTLIFVKDPDLVRQDQRQRFFRTTQVLLSHIEVVQIFRIGKADDSEDTASSNDYQSLATGLSINGMFAHSMHYKDDVAHSHMIKYPTTYWGLGLLDNFTAALAQDNSKPVLCYDWVAGVFGVNMLNDQGTIFGNWEIKAIYGGQTLIHPSMKVNGVEYKYVRRFREDKSEEASEDNQPDRYISTYSLGQVAMESNLSIGISIGKAGYLYLFGGARYQGDFGGGWYRSDDIHNWDTFVSDKPSEVFLPELPKRNVIYDRLTFKFGIGIRLPI